MKLVFVIVLSVFLASCSMLPKLLSGAFSSGGVQSDIQVGDRDNALQIQGARGSGDIVAKDDAVVNVTSSNADQNIDKAETVNITNVSPLVLLLLILGWVLPTPTSMFRGLKQWLQRIRQRRSQQGSGQKYK